MRFLNQVLCALCLTVVTAGVASSARAVLIVPDPGTQNTTEPTSPAVVPGWYNVGRISIGSGVYLGNRWVLTACHLDPLTNPTITFYTNTALPNDGFPSNGTPYAIDTSPGASHRLTNADGSNTDLILVRTLTDPGLPPLTISSATPAANTKIVMAGIGVARGAPVQYDANFTEVSSGGVYSGYKYDPNDDLIGAVAKRWGTSTTSSYSPGVNTTVINNTINNSFTTCLAAVFRGPLQFPTSNESIAVNGDSGGAVFSQNSPNTLLGINLYNLGYTNQPTGSALYGDASAPADLATYAGQINGFIAPEPASGLLIVGGIALLGLRRRKIAV